MEKNLTKRLLVITWLHVILFILFKDTFIWYFHNIIRNEFYTFSIVFVAVWLTVFSLYNSPIIHKKHILFNYILLVVLWVSYLLFKNRSFAVLAILLTSFISFEGVFKRTPAVLDSIYASVIFTVPLPFLVEFLGVLQIFSAKASVLLYEFAFGTIERAGSTIFFASGPLKIASSCSGFQSFVVLTALAGMLSFFFNINFFGKCIIILSAILSSVFFNVFRIFSVLIVADNFGVETAVSAWHGFSGWLFYIITPAFLWFISKWLKKSFSYKI